MKRKLAVLSMLLFAIFALTGISQAQGFRLKLSGGYGTMTTGDYNSYGAGLDSLIGILEALGATTEGEFNKINLGFEYEAELIWSLPAGFGVGVGVGYIRRGETTEMNASLPLVGSASASIVPKITAIPVNLSAYYFTPGVVPLKFFVYGGIGYYFGKMTIDIREDSTPPAFWSEQEAMFKDQGFGLHGGIGLEFKVAPRIALFIEGRARQCKLKGWDGDGNYEDSDGITDIDIGSLWYLEELDQNYGSGEWLPGIMLSRNIPVGSDIRNVRKFELNLSGVSLRTGIRIKF
jgi:opacity protein-like surface antigen